MKALVTGAAGFIGSTLSTALLDRKAAVVGIDCFTDYYARAIKEQNLEPLRSRSEFQFVEAALQTVDLEPLLDGVTHVFHLAAQAGVRGSWGEQFQTYTSHNVDATQRLLEMLTGRPIARLVYASSSSVYGDVAPIPMREDAYIQPVSPYGVTKLAAEHLCNLYHANHGVPAVSLRYFTVYGPRQRPDMGFHRFIRAALLGEPITLFGDGEQSRDFTFVDDAVGATMAAGDRGRPGTVYNIGGGCRRKRETCAIRLPIPLERGPSWDSSRRIRSKPVSPLNVSGWPDCSGTPGHTHDEPILALARRPIDSAAPDHRRHDCLPRPAGADADCR
jgi:UDP-glucose 4-epimerase